jgi:archaellum component FlaC
LIITLFKTNCLSLFVIIRQPASVDLGGRRIIKKIRIDNALDTLSERLKGLTDELNKLENRQIDIKAELDKNEGYSDEIEFFKKKVKDIDKKLGVKK